MKGNENSRVIVINSKNSNISSINKNDDYLNNVYKELYEIYGIDVKNIKVYFIWDRDNKSNNYKIVKKLISTLGSSIDNGEEMNGLLLLSYPAIEAYIISNFDKKTFSLKDKSLKQYIKNQNYKVSDITKSTLLNAVIMMHKHFLHFGINDYNLDDFSSTSLKIFEKQESLYNNRNYYNLLSLVSLILLDLNIITYK